MPTRPLPEPAISQTFFTVSALEAGKIVLPERLYVTDADPTAARRCPSLAFLLTHSGTGKRVVFDLGIRKHTTAYPPAAQKFIADYFKLDVEQDVAESIRAGGLDAADIEYVVLSHMHFDHTGDPAPFTRATFVAGAGGRALLESGYPLDQTSNFDSRLLPAERTQWLDPSQGDDWRAVGPFDRALDFFGDGSLYIVDAPGHIAGHVNVLARTRDGWIYLAGDTAHDMRLMSGERHICVLSDGTSAHTDKELAAQHIRNVQALKEEYGVPYILAHEFEWDEKHVDAYLPGMISS